MSEGKSFARFPGPVKLASDPDDPVDGFGWEEGTPGRPGYLPGCRTSGSVSGPIDQQMRVLTPSWTPVDTQPATSEEEREVEGILTNSFTTWTDAPVTQYHLWYDWNFHLVPDEPYQYLKGLGNAEFEKQGDQAVYKGESHSMECEWDTGNFAQGEKGVLTPGGFYDHRPRDRATADWGWPQRAQKVWLTGRWIYDCGHAAKVDPENRANEDGNERERMLRHRSELHPVKAMATLRTEGFKFPENAFAVPATQFVFFACKRGGYVDFEHLNDRDYSFLVDLPDPPSSPQSPVTLIDLGRPRGSHSYTLDLRLPFLVHWRFFGHGAGGAGELERMARCQPRIEAHNPDGEALPKQARVTIPLSVLPDDVEKYGVMVSFGWPDPDASLARKVRKVTVKLDKVIALRDHPLSKGILGITEIEGPTEEWLIRAGVNGRWWTKERPTENIDPGDSIDVDWTVEMFLADTDALRISCHGNEESLVGDVFYDDTRRERRIEWESNVPVTWRQIEDPRLSEDIITKLLGKTWHTLNLQNYPLGRLEWFSRPPSGSHVGPTSLVESAGGVPALDPLPESYEGRFVLRANALNEDTVLAETWEKDDESDYELHVHLKIEPQPGLPGPA